ncbi:E3 ubiquitin-protein ligase TRIM56-like [Diadema setosum]|uniref:E3 ubiquitin-protein ligase TRIM56-like n=1 Tax=Diadema setosum TaxID=31175 RepID=UPI003B3A6ED9
MAEATDRESMEKEDVTCAVCMDKLTDAKFLRCFHSFCTRCLEHCTRNLKVSCPLCREVTSVSKGIDSLLPNLTATRRAREARVREKIEAKIHDGGCQCESCKELGAVCLAKSYCVDCQLLICDKCVGAHNLLKLTRCHRIIGVLEFQNNEILKEQEVLGCDEGLGERQCNKHGDSLSMYCRTCRQPVCPQCADLYHHELDDHDCVSINDMTEEFSKEVQQLRGKIEPRNFDQLSELYEQRLKQVRDRARELRSKVNESAQNEIASVYAKIEAKRAGLNTRILDMEKTSCRKVTTALSTVRRLRARAAKIDGYADEFLATGNSADILAAKGTLVDQLKDIRTEMRKLSVIDSDAGQLERYSFTPLDWTSSNYEAGVGRLDPCKAADASPLDSDRIKRRTPPRLSGRVHRQTTSMFPPLSTRRSVVR